MSLEVEDYQYNNTLREEDFQSIYITVDYVSYTYGKDSNTTFSDNEVRTNETKKDREEVMRETTPFDGTTCNGIPLHVRRSLTPTVGRLSVTPGLRETSCQMFHDLGRLLVHSLAPLPRVQCGNLWI